MISCLDLGFLGKIKSSDLLTYLAFLLAYIAYAWSVNRDLDSWKSLFVSFKTDLECQKGWLVNEYFADNYQDKDTYSPKKIIYPLSFESLPEIIRRGVDELRNIPGSFVGYLSLFNERIIAFNSAIDHIKKINSANPITTEKLIDKLKILGIDKEDASFRELKKQIVTNKENDEILYLAENNRRLHRVIHLDLIGNKNNPYGLHFLYCKITVELEEILNNFDSHRPLFVKYKYYIVLGSIPWFLIIEACLK